MLKVTTIGDMARGFISQRQTSALKTTLERLGNEVTTGRAQDVSKAVRGDFQSLGAIEASLNQLKRYETTLAEAQSFAEAGQRALETVQDRALTTATSLLTVSSSAEITVVDAVTRDARQGFSAVISAMNTQIGGRGIFGGTTTNLPALAEGDVMMADIIGIVSGLTTADDITAAISGWFDDPGGGFETLGYTGSQNRLLPFDLGLGATADFDFAADDQEIRDILKGFAIGGVLEAVGVALAPAERQNLVRQGGELLLGAEKNLAQYRAGVGTSEAAIDAAMARNSNEMFGLEISRARIVNVDQYAAAGELEATQIQLEMIYTITARMSRLNLMEFLR